ncbi:MAG: sulfate adenylyltransferase [Epsilonproteobacteria bacterium]|nr:sulfate adenylyltransferase [Campylobacterota bacterium]
MGSQKRNRELYLDSEALATLRMCKEGILSPVTRLMNKQEAEQVDATSAYQGKYFPFSFILAPSGRRNEEVLKSAKKNDILDIIVNDEKCGELVVDEVFLIDREKRVEKIFSTTDPSNPGVADTLRRLGNYAISGETRINSDEVKKYKREIQEQKELLGAKKISAVMLSAKPFHRAHERMIRIALDKSDLLVLFLLKPYKHDSFTYDIRYKTLKYFIDNFLPKNRVIIIPFENTYLFAGLDNIILDSIAAKNYGCNSISIGQSHQGIGMYYDKNGTKSIIDYFKELDIGITMNVVNEFVYCNECKTLVSTRSCPHGRHHHISYNSELIYELLKVGVLPPAVLVRKELSAIILSHLFPNRFEDLTGKFTNFFPGTGLIEEMNEEQFYMQIMSLHQTVSLT